MSKPRKVWSGKLRSPNSALDMRKGTDNIGSRLIWQTELNLSWRDLEICISKETREKKVPEEWSWY